MMKQIFILCMIAAGMLLQSCEDEVALTGLTAVSEPDRVLVLGERMRVRVTLTPADATGVNLVWTSSDESVISLNNDIMTAVSLGTSVITVSSGSFSASFNVEAILRQLTVTAPPNTEIKPGAQFRLTAIPDPAGTPISPVWSSDNEAVATVNASGDVTVTGEGVANIRAAVGSVSGVYAVISEADMRASAVGHWTFDDPNDLVKATAGQPLVKQGDGFTPVAGPSAGNGAVRIAQGSYFKALHGMAANGGGSRVNNYTVLFDFKVSELGRYYSFIQTTLENNDDAEFFLRPAGNLGVGGTGYSERAVTAGEWHRLVISAGMGKSYLYYLDGELIHEGNVANATVDSRWAWLPEGVLFFADEDGEDAEIDVAEVVIWNSVLDGEQVKALSAPRYPNAAALWSFDDVANLGKASVGSDLVLTGDGFTPVAGPRAGNGAVRVAQGSYFKALHGMAANGGGSRVNNYTVLFDFKVSELGRYYSFIQTTLENNDDAEFFLRPAGNLGVGGTGYSGHVVTAGEWHRLVISAGMGKAYLYYLDGVLIHEGNVANATVDSRWSWLPEGVLFFADEDGEDAEIDIADVVVWSSALDGEQVKALDTP
ncbi:MAG: Ig-like domain-containing protein [Tannerella sp.]|jgi:hypothetical protein|nr:Ig-like domain-containing protein [Tannerella sp.]